MSDKIYKSNYGSKWHQECNETLSKGRQLPQMAKNPNSSITANAPASDNIILPISNLPPNIEVDITQLPSELELDYWRLRREIVQVRNDNRALNNKIVHLLKVLVEARRICEMGLEMKEWPTIGEWYRYAARVKEAVREGTATGTRAGSPTAGKGLSRGRE